MGQKIRLDLHLLTKGLARSRQEAQRLIRAGKVRDVNGKLLEKPGQEVFADLDLKVKKSPRFVSRGGDKLLGALQAFPLQIRDRVCIDGGISTGGFTDCLLQHGVSRVYGIDVGYGQTSWNLRNHPNVVLKERTNLRKIKPEDLYSKGDPWADFAVIDLSFISLRIVLPSLRILLKPGFAEAILLVKPQFEVGRERVGKGGIVRDSSAHIFALHEVIEASSAQDWKPKGLIPSPLKGATGNQEYLLWLGTDIKKNSQPFLVEDVVEKALA